MERAPSDAGFGCGLALVVIAALGYGVMGPEAERTAPPRQTQHTCQAQAPPNSANEMKGGEEAKEGSAARAIDSIEVARLKADALAGSGSLKLAERVPRGPSQRMATRPSA